LGCESTRNSAIQIKNDSNASYTFTASGLKLPQLPNYSITKSFLIRADSRNLRLDFLLRTKLLHRLFCSAGHRQAVHILHAYAPGVLDGQPHLPLLQPRQPLTIGWHPQVPPPIPRWLPLPAKAAATLRHDPRWLHPLPPDLSQVHQALLPDRLSVLVIFHLYLDLDCLDSASSWPLCPLCAELQAQ
jgi:hypothetical protein